MTKFLLIPAHRPRPSKMSKSSPRAIDQEFEHEIHPTRCSYPSKW